MGTAVEKKKIVIMEDHPMMASGIKTYIDAQEGWVTCCVADSCKAMQAFLADCTPDLVLLDLYLNQGSGLDAIKLIPQLAPDCKILVYTMVDEEVMGERCIRAGAHGYLSKQAPAEELGVAIHTVLGGTPYLSTRLSKRILEEWRGEPGESESDHSRIKSLTDRESQVLQRMAYASPNRSIAEELGISVKTVERHQENMKGKLHLQSNFELKSLAREKFTGGLGI